MNDDNSFENMPFDEALAIYIEYLKAVKKGDVKIINSLFAEYPNLFEKENLKLAKTSLRCIAKKSKNKFLIDLLDYAP